MPDGMSNTVLPTPERVKGVAHPARRNGFGVGTTRMVRHDGEGTVIAPRLGGPEEHNDVLERTAGGNRAAGPSGRKGLLLLLESTRMEVRQRPDWHGSPIHLGELFNRAQEQSG